MDALILQDIQSKLNEIETQHKVKILYACESGSRAWGFPSRDSDYDVRFIYAFQPDAYLSIEEPKDIIEIPVNEVLDVNGWDIRKVLRLFRKSNAAIYEWLQSPIVYKKQGALLSQLTTVMNEYFSPRDGMHHYIGVAKNALSALSGDEIKLKKYFYCMRSLLAAMWIADTQQVPPMEFATLRTLVSDKEWNTEIDSLLVLKAGGNESNLIKPNPLLQHFIDTNLALCEEKAATLKKKETSSEMLNQLFRELIHEI